MGSIVRLCGLVAAVLTAMLAALWSAVTAVVVPLASVTALVLGGTGNSLLDAAIAGNTPEQVFGYLNGMRQNYIDPSVHGWSQGSDSVNGALAVYSPEQFWPEPGHTLTFDQSVNMGVANLSSCIAAAAAASCKHNESAQVLTLSPDQVAEALVVFGYSQSARIVTDVKRQLVQYYDAFGWDDAPELSFVVIGNPDRPNGGIMERFAGLSIPFFGITFDGATPTNSGCDAAGGNCHFDTSDIAWQYDGYANFPSHPLNVLADVNAVLGIFYEHGFYNVGITAENLASGAIIDQGTYQDTHYYMIPAKTLPVLAPLANVLPAPVLTALDTPLRTIIEMGYDRSVSPGVATTAKWFRFSPVRDAITVGIAVATGLDDAIAQASGNPANRPLGTTAVTGPYGVPEFQWSDLAPKKTAAKAVEAIEPVVKPVAVKAESEVESLKPGDQSAAKPDGKEETVVDREATPADVKPVKRRPSWSGLFGAHAKRNGAVGAVSDVKTEAVKEDSDPSADPPKVKADNTDKDGTDNTGKDQSANDKSDKSDKAPKKRPGHHHRARD